MWNPDHQFWLNVRTYFSSKILTVKLHRYKDWSKYLPFFGKIPLWREIIHDVYYGYKWTNFVRWLDIYQWETASHSSVSYGKSPFTEKNIIPINYCWNISKKVTLPVSYGILNPMVNWFTYDILTPGSIFHMLIWPQGQFFIIVFCTPLMVNWPPPHISTKREEFIIP